MRGHRDSEQPTNRGTCPQPSPCSSFQVLSGGRLPEDSRRDEEGIHLLVSFEAESFGAKSLQEALEESTERCLG